MRLNLKPFIVGAILGALLLFTAACSSSSITASLDLLVTLTETAVDIAAPAEAAQLTPYFADISKFVDEVTAELASTDAAAQKASVITADASMIAAPNLTGLTGEIVTKVGALAPVIAQIVSAVEALTAGIEATPGGANAFLAAHKIKPPTAKQIAAVQSHNAKLKAKLKAK